MISVIFVSDPTFELLNSVLVGLKVSVVPTVTVSVVPTDTIVEV